MRRSDDDAPFEPIELDADMTRDDLIWMLQQLRFGKRANAKLRIDQQVRDYLVARLRPEKRRS